MSEQPKSLAAKMAGVMGDVPTMIKNGTNQQQRYQYVTAEDVKAAIRPLLKRHGIAVYSEMTDVKRETGNNKNGTLTVTVLAKMRFTLASADTDESMTCEWYGEANDYADKAVNKAATAAEKYWLINTFLLSTTEALESDEETVETPVYAQPAPQPNIIHDGRYPVETPGRITKSQMAAIGELSKAVWGGEVKEKGAEYVRRVYGCALAELSDHEAARLVTDLQRKVTTKEAAPA
jgi:hypothetical protein